MIEYLIAREHDDRLESMTRMASYGENPDEEAERELAAYSSGYPGSLLLFRDGKLMAHAKGGVVYSYRENAPRTSVAA